ncbi:MAG: copper amine oxidase N-terminal domain-containing protein [Caldisericaceae bacterium]
MTSTDGGTVSPSGVVEVPFGGWINFTITPKEGYKVKELYLGTRRFDPYTSFKVTDIAVNTSFNAVFDKVAVETKSKVIILQVGDMNFTVDGASNTLDSPPIIKNGRTLLPIRAIIEALSGSVAWDANAKKVTISLGSNSIELWIGKSTATVNGVSKPIDSSNNSVVPEIISGRTMLPVRFVTENLGAKVDWDGTTNTVTITYPAP